MLTLPFPLRYRVAYAPKLQAAILRIFVRCLRARQEREARALGLADPAWGAITVIQRFGSALQLTPHFHTLGMDGVYTIEAGRRASFHPLPPPTRQEIRDIVSEVRRRVIASLRRRGLISPEDGTWADVDSPGLDLIEYEFS